MDIIREMYNIHSGSEEAEDSLRSVNKELYEYIDSNMAEKEKAIFADTVNSIIKAREEYFFKSGFRLAVKLLMN